MTYAAQVAITATTAWDTLGIVARQSRKDTRKVIAFTYSTYILLTSPEAKQTYRAIYKAAEWITVTGWMICVALWLTLGEWADGFVQSCIEQPALTESEVEPTASEIPTPAPVAVVHTPKPVKFPAFILGELPEQTRPIAGLLPAGVSTKPATVRKSSKSRRKAKQQLVGATA